MRVIGVMSAVAMTSCGGTGSDAGGGQGGRGFGGLFSRTGPQTTEKPAEEAPEPSEKRRPEVPRKVGAIRLCHGTFVLISARARTAPAAGARLTTLDGGGQPTDVELEMTDVRKGTFLVADVISGNPQSGATVVTVVEEEADEEEYQFLE